MSTDWKGYIQWCFITFIELLRLRGLKILGSSNGEIFDFSNLKSDVEPTIPNDQYVIK